MRQVRWYIYKVNGGERGTERYGLFDTKLEADVERDRINRERSLVHPFNFSTSQCPDLWAEQFASGIYLNIQPLRKQVM